MKKLSPREQQVMMLLANGLTCQEAAQNLKLEITTIKTHVLSVRNKIEAHNIPHAVAILVSNGSLHI